MAGGSRHLLGDVIRSLQPKYLKQVAESIKSNVEGMPKPTTDNLDDFCNSMKAPSSDEIRLTLKQQQTKEEREFRAHLEDGSGPPSALATKRLFGVVKERVVLYRDWQPGVPTVKKCGLHWKKMQPNGNLPCAIIDGKVYSESNDIVEALDAIGAPGTPILRPNDKEKEIRQLCDNGRNSLERRLYAQWMWWLTGVRRPQEYKQLYEELLDEMEEALSNEPGKFFLGDELSIVDIRFIPFIERQVASFAYFKGYDIRDGSRPKILTWLQAMESRPSYQATKSDYYTHSQSLPPQLSADCALEDTCDDMKGNIESLPIGDGISSWVEPGWGWVRPEQAGREAVERLCHAPDRIVKFSARGSGVAGFPAASAPLADPAAVPNEELYPGVDVLLRHIASSILGMKTTSLDESIHILDEPNTKLLFKSLDYLRARIGVPRDMSYPAAAVLRKELVEVSKALQTRRSTTGALLT